MSDTEIEINDVFEDLFLCEEKFVKQGYDEGFKAGIEKGNTEAYHSGYHNGVEIGKELGYYFILVAFHLKALENKSESSNEKIKKQLKKFIESVQKFSKENWEEDLEQIRGNFKRICSLLKIDNKYATTTAVSF